MHRWDRTPHGFSSPKGRGYVLQPHLPGENPCESKKATLKQQECGEAKPSYSRGLLLTFMQTINLCRFSEPRWTFCSFRLFSAAACTNFFLQVVALAADDRNELVHSTVTTDLLMPKWSCYLLTTWIKKMTAQLGNYHCINIIPVHSKRTVH